MDQSAIPLTVGAKPSVRAEASASRRDRAATLALVLGLASLFIGILGPLAIVTSMRSLARIRAAEGAVTGETSALLGLVAGCLATVFMVAGLVMFFLLATL